MSIDNIGDMKECGHAEYRRIYDKYKEKLTVFSSYSGGILGMPLGAAKHRVLILEAAELDDAHLAMALEHIAAANPGTQILCNSCHRPASVPDGWNVVEVGDAA